MLPPRARPCLIHNGPDIAPRDPLPRLLAQIGARLGSHCMIAGAQSRPWASALFEGRRHVVTLMVTGADAGARCDRFAQELGDLEWSLPAHFVADIVIDDRRSDGEGEHIALSALTIRDW